MTPEQKLLLAIACWIGLMSIIAFFITVSDKIKAKKGRWRVPEATLLGISALGGSVAMLLTMLAIRHKTRHAKFMVGIPVIIVLQLAAAVAVWWFCLK